MDEITAITDESVPVKFAASYERSVELPNLRKPGKLTERTVCELLIGWLKRQSRGWLVIDQLRGGSGYGGANERTIDLWAITAENAHGNPAWAFEIKVSHSDYARDVVKFHEKHRAALMLSDRFYYVAPLGMIDPATLPPEAGLIEIASTADGQPSIGIKRQAYARNKGVATWPFIVSLIRRAARVVEC